MIENFPSKDSPRLRNEDYGLWGVTPLLALLFPFLRSRCAPTDSRLTTVYNYGGGGAGRRVDPLAKSSSVWWIRTGDDLRTG